MTILAEVGVPEDLFARRTPWIIGIASMCASPQKSDHDVARIRRHIEELAELAEA